jgi:thiamine monophosphate kinase
MGAAGAHHSFAATYDASRQMQIEGEVAQFLFRNPHSMVHILAPDDSGEMHRWAIEWAGVNVLTGQGITRETLRIGDGVIVTGNPGRLASDHRMRMLSIERPTDGWKWRGTFE